MTLPVVEAFTSIQGEGPRAGRLCAFLRFGGCNLSCGFAGGWQCDSGYTWDTRHYDLKEEITPMSPVMILRLLVDPEVGEVVLTGGEPLMHQKNPDWAVLLRALKAKNKFISVETNGTLAPIPATQTFVDHYSISPKLSNTRHKPNQDPTMALWPQHIRVSKSCLKFVVSTAADVKEGVALADELGWPRWSTWVQPEGVTPEAVLKNYKAIAEEAIRLRINCGQRLHILAWGDERGR